MAKKLHRDFIAQEIVESSTRTLTIEWPCARLSYIVVKRKGFVDNVMFYLTEGITSFTYMRNFSRSELIEAQTLFDKFANSRFVDLADLLQFAQENGMY